jgi:hypothetical protein
MSRSSEALTEDEESDQEFELVRETDAERREALLTSDQDADSSNKLGSSSSWKALEQEFAFNNHDQATSSNVPIDDIIDLSSDNDDDHCSIPVASGSTFTHGHSNAAKGKGKFKSSNDITENSSSNTRHPKSNATGLGRIEAEMDPKSLDMVPVKGGGRTVGPRSAGMTKNAQSAAMKWNCLVCTLSVTFCYSVFPRCCTHRCGF